MKSKFSLFISKLFGFSVDDKNSNLEEEKKASEESSNNVNNVVETEKLKEGHQEEKAEGEPLKTEETDYSENNHVLEESKEVSEEDIHPSEEEMNNKEL